LVLAACQTPEVPPTIVELPSQGYARGIDMATDSSDVVSQLQGRRWLHFVARYYRDPASRFPTLSPDEARRLAALGVKIVTVWEWHSSTPSYFTYANGYNDALSAYRQAKGVGQPPGSAIYFAVDFNARGNAMLAVDQYFRGVAAGFAASGRGRPEYRVGVYGSGAVCAAVRGAGLAQYAWLSGSMAWDGTAGYNDWNIRQAAAGARFANLSFDHDANDARNDYGGFQLGNYARAAPQVDPVVTVAAAAPAAAASLVSGAVNAVVPQPTTPAPPPPAPLVAAAPAPPPVAPLVAAAPPPPAAPALSPPPVAAATAAPRPISPVVAAAPPPAAPPPPRPVPAAAPSAAAAEVAALAAAEPKFAAAGPPPRALAEPEPPASSRRSEPTASEERPRERASAHAAKSAAAGKGKVRPVAATSRAVAAPSRHAAREAHEAARKPAAAHRTEQHAAHRSAAKTAAAAHTPEHATHHHKEQP
jgi:hypothetical protein